MTKRIFIAGHNGMVGSALMRQLEKDINNSIITANFKDLDLRNQPQVTTPPNPIEEFYRHPPKWAASMPNDPSPFEHLHTPMMECNVSPRQACRAYADFLAESSPQAPQRAHERISTVKWQA